MESDEQDEIPVGKRLVRAQGGGGESLAERLTSQFYRLTWRTPLHALRLRGRYPLKLLAVPDDPVAGDASTGLAILRGELTWRGEQVECGRVDFGSESISSGFANYLQRFQWLRDLAAAGSRAQVAPVAEMLTRRWLSSHADRVSEPAWRQDLWGWRILFWATHAPLILSSTDLVYRSAVLNGLARGARHLDRSADRAPIGLQRIAAWAGIVAAGLLITGGGPRRSFGEAGLARALNTGFSADGGLVCRTPGGQLDAVMLLAMLSRVYDSRRIEPPAFLASALNLSVPSLLGVTLGDGGLSSWQGSLPIEAPQVESIIAASGVRTRPQRQARDWGYQRAAAGQTVVVMDAAPPPDRRVARGGCASTLAFELSDGAHRLVINCGGANAGGAFISAGLANGLRTTAAHSTLILADSNSTAIHADGTLGRGVSEIALERQENEGSSRIEASHDGYVRRFGLIHKRTLLLSGDGRELRGDDVLLPSKAKQKPMTSAFAIRFHLAPGIEATPTADGMGALLRIERGALWQFRCRGGTLSVEESLWIDGQARPHGTVQLVVSGEASPGGASVGWVLRRAG